MARISLCRLVLAISLFAFALTQAVATPPSLPREAGWEIAVPFDYPDADAVRKAWKAIEKAMPPVDLVDAGPRKALALPLRFEGNDLGRMAWDGACALDLSGARSVFLRLYCDAPLPVGSITVYLRSGAGYYWFKPPVPEPGAWRDVEIQRMDMAIEGKPGPWSEVSSIRVSPWRGSTGTAPSTSPTWV